MNARSREAAYRLITVSKMSTTKSWRLRREIRRACMTTTWAPYLQTRSGPQRGSEPGVLRRLTRVVAMKFGSRRKQTPPVSRVQGADVWARSPELDSKPWAAVLSPWTGCMLRSEESGGFKCGSPGGGILPSRPRMPASKEAAVASPSPSPAVSPIQDSMIYDDGKRAYVRALPRVCDGRRIWRDMSRRTLGIGLVLGGLLMAAVSLFADYLGVGAHPGILGWKQILGAVAGVAISLAGGFAFREPKPSLAGPERTEEAPEQ